MRRGQTIRLKVFAYRDRDGSIVVGGGVGDVSNGMTVLGSAGEVRHNSVVRVLGGRLLVDGHDCEGRRYSKSSGGERSKERETGAFVQH